MVLALFALAVTVGVAVGVIFERIVLGMLVGGAIAMLALYASYKRLTAESQAPPPPERKG